MHFMLCLAGMIVGEVIAVLAGLAIFCDGSDDLRMIIIKSCIAFAMFTVLAVITSICLLKDAKRGYESGFFDGDPAVAPQKSETALTAGKESF